MRKNLIKLLKKIQGVHTLESVITILGINRIQAIKTIYNLRKKGYVKTKRLSNNRRVYKISFENRLGGYNYIDKLNQISPIQISGANIHKIYGKEISPEEVLILAIKSKSLRQILASLALFKKINNWPKLYQSSKKEGLEREIGALYDLSRRIIKTRRMTRRFENLALQKKSEKYHYLIEGLNSKDFKDIESKWRVYLPFNMADLEDYL